MKSKASLFLLFLLTCEAYGQENVYLSKFGTDEGNCSVNNPCLTWNYTVELINHINVSNNGYNLHIENGSYPASQQLNTSHLDRVQINGESSQNTMIMDNVANNNQLMTFNHVKNINISNLTINASIGTHLGYIESEYVTIFELKNVQLVDLRNYNFTTLSSLSLVTIDGINQDAVVILDNISFEFKIISEFSRKMKLINIGSFETVIFKDITMLNSLIQLKNVSFDTMTNPPFSLFELNCSHSINCSKIEMNGLIIKNVTLSVTDTHDFVCNNLNFIHFDAGNGGNGANEIINSSYISNLLLENVQINIQIAQPYSSYCQPNVFSLQNYEHLDYVCCQNVSFSNITITRDFSYDDDQLNNVVLFSIYCTNYLKFENVIMSNYYQLTAAILAHAGMSENSGVYGFSAINYVYLYNISLFNVNVNVKNRLNSINDLVYVAGDSIELDCVYFIHSSNYNKVIGNHVIFLDEISRVKISNSIFSGYILSHSDSYLIEITDEQYSQHNSISIKFNNVTIENMRATNNYHNPLVYFYINWTPLTKIILDNCTFKNNSEFTTMISFNTLSKVDMMIKNSIFDQNWGQCDANQRKNVIFDGAVGYPYYFNYNIKLINCTIIGTPFLYVGNVTLINTTIINNTDIIKSPPCATINNKYVSASNGKDKYNVQLQYTIHALTIQYHVKHGTV